MTRILVGYDGSDGANTAVDLVSALPWPGGSAGRLVTAVPDPTQIRSAWGRMIAGDPAALGAALEAGATGGLAEPRHRLAAAGLAVETAILRGRPPQAIAADAAEWGADLLVVGSRGLGPASSALIGSVSEEIVDEAPCPVLVARHETVRGIILATDGSACAQASERVVASLPIAAQVPVQVVSVAHIVRAWTTGIAPTWISTVLREQAQMEDAARDAQTEIAEAAAARLRDQGVQAASVARSGDPVAEILLAAEAGGADLIVIGSRGQTGLRRLVLGSVARKVLHRATGSVLVVRAGVAGSGCSGSADEIGSGG